jgi:RHS repeat-associated protein
MVRLCFPAALLVFLILGSNQPTQAGVPDNSVQASGDAANKPTSNAEAFGAVPVGGKTSPAEDRALEEALAQYRKAVYPDEVKPLENFIDRYPNSAWNPSLLLNIGVIYRNTGHFSQALTAWKKAWLKSENFTDPNSKAIADAALGKLTAFYAYSGNEKELTQLISTLHGRALSGPATEEVSSATAQLSEMRGKPQFAFRCGALALNRICLLARNGKSLGPLYGSRATAQGMSLAQLLQLSKTVGLDYQMAYRSRGAVVLTPSVVHWKVGHYSAVLSQIGKLYRIGDSVGREILVRSSAINEEATGYFLVPTGTLPEGWRAVSPDEGANIWGRGATGGNYPLGPGPADPQAFPQGCGGNGSGDGGGMPTYNVAAMSVSLELHDRLLSYKPALGPTVSFETFYNQRDYQNNGQPGFYYTNFGPKWTSNWISYIDDGVYVLNEAGAVGGGYANLYLPGGGVETYSFNDNPFSAVSYPGLLTQAILTKTGIGQSRIEILSGGAIPSPFGSPGAPGGGQGSGVVVSPLTPPGPLPEYEFLRQLPDGSAQIFAQRVCVFSNSPPCRYFLTQVVDPQGHTVTLKYDSMMRITSITDAAGKVTQLLYKMASDPRKVTAVVDPFGRSANFFYSSDGTHLVKTVDPGGIESTYTYGQGQAQMSSDADFISSLTTPYGTTTFATTDIIDVPNQLNPFWRTLTITDPLGQTSRVDQREGVSQIPDSDPEAAVPQINFPPDNPTLSINDKWLEFRNVYVWDPEQLLIAMQTPNPPSGTPGEADFVPGSPDYTKSRIMHFLHEDLNTASFLLESTKNPLENRVWYFYSGQQLSYAVFSNTQPTNPVIVSNKPTIVARVLDDGTTQVTQVQRNKFGHITQLVDPQLPVGRLYNFQYASNDIDLRSIAAGPGASALTLFQASYNNSHEPLTITDAAKSTSTLIYNPSDFQLSSFTNALGQTTKFIYDPASHFLTTIQVSLDNVNFVVQRAFTYDGVGRVNTVTDELGYTKTFSYDAYDRFTNIGFPDGTNEKWTYNLLDIATFTDRMNRHTNYLFDSDRRLQQITDPMNRTTKFTFCPCGQISSVTDPGNNTTVFNYDADDRITSRQYADGRKAIYTYESTTSRLKSLTDGAGQGPSYTYNSDNTLSAVGPASGGPPLVTFKYDPVLLRRIGMTDTTGSTAYSYYPTPAGALPSPGATLLAAETGPFGDTVSYAYDGLGRISALSVNGVTSSFNFDNIGREKVANNPLGTFYYSYWGTSNRIVQVNSTSGIQMAVNYYGLVNDNLPQQINWYEPAGPAPAQSQACKNDLAQSSQTQAQLAADIAWLNDHCGSNWRSEVLNNNAACNQNGQNMISTVGQLEQELSPQGILTTQRVEDCAPPNPPRRLLAFFAYKYDSDDEITQITFDGALVNFPANSGVVPSTGTYAVNHDSDGELLSVTPVGGQPGDPSFAYSYSPASNLLSTQNVNATTTYTYNNVNQLTTSGTSYDDDGNLAGLGATQYTWIPSVGSSPVMLREPDWNLATIQYEGGTVTQFRYDGLGRRNEIIELNNGQTLSDRQFIWCGFTICQEHVLKSSTPSLAPGVKTYFTQGLLYNSVPYYYTLDAQGSVYHQLDSDGAVISQSQYDPYGNQIQVSGTWRPSDMGYTGMLEHQPSGLALAVFRPYSPAIGRWLNRDPLSERGALGFSAVNLYNYVSSDPIELADNLGLQSGPFNYWTQNTGAPDDPIWTMVPNALISNFSFLNYLDPDTMGEAWKSLITQESVKYALVDFGAPAFGQLLVRSAATDSLSFDVFGFGGWLAAGRLLPWVAAIGLGVSILATAADVHNRNEACKNKPWTPSPYTGSPYPGYSTPY